MNKKVEKWIRTTCWKGMIKANNINKRMGVDLGEERLTLWLDKYIKFLDITFKITTTLTFATTMLWFFPEYIGIPYDRMILIMLVIIVVILKFGSIKVKIQY